MLKSARSSKLSDLKEESSDEESKSSGEWILWIPLFIKSGMELQSQKKWNLELGIPLKILF
jgi:hypothetical protein